MEFSLAYVKDTDKVDWGSQVDLSHLSDEDLKEDILEMMSGHELMWSGRLGQISFTSHTIGLAPGTRPIMQHPYRMGLHNRKFIAEHV